ncbi:type I 3-dehydroquinate dehydratase [Halovivax cerinus]|uniref:3-dehydroquinate dehydratase n=1 Tax=Halovivax cerinus TaxID=1487865 RepID=A0ABD5NMZ8_9EURY|nr:type I 3-dehydroquinate dehydratase [Halovivax cerinus]
MNFESLVLAVSTASLDDEPAARAHADAIEFRLDRADEPLAELDAYDGSLPILATNRAAWEGGAATSNETARIETLAAATAREAVHAVDVELAAIRAGDADRVLDAARDRDVAVVVSIHDFRGTPRRRTLEALLAEASRHGDVAKLAVTATDRTDTLTLLEATHDATTAGRTVATMAMGSIGSHTRVVAPIYGSHIAYAPLDPDARTAPGQLDLATLSNALDAVGLDRSRR